MPEIAPVLRPRFNPSDDPSTPYTVYFYLSDLTTYNESSRVKNFLKERFNTLRTSDHIVPIRMAKADYEAFFAPNVSGSAVYASYAAKPEGGRRRWLKGLYTEQRPEARTLGEVKRGAIARNDEGTEKGSLVGWGADGRKG